MVRSGQEADPTRVPGPSERGMNLSSEKWKSAKDF